MTRRLHDCRGCPGKTRHENRVCSVCRDSDIVAPTLAQLNAGVDVTRHIAGLPEGSRMVLVRDPLTYRGRGG